MRKTAVVCALAMAVLALSADRAHAGVNLNLKGGVSFGTSGWDGINSPAPLAGAELTWGFGSIFQLGGFFENDFITYSDNSTGSLDFFGLVARLGFGYVSNLFADAQLGLDHRSAGSFGSGTSAGFGFGAGYRFWLGPFVDFAPRAGYRLLTEGGGSRSSVDTELLIEFGF